MKRRPYLEHLKWVARHECLACYKMLIFTGNIVSQAAHVRYLSGVGLGQRDDRYVVPLCPECHRRQHATGNERRWWEGQRVDPALHVAELQRESKFLREAA